MSIEPLRVARHALCRTSAMGRRSLSIAVLLFIAALPSAARADEERAPANVVVDEAAQARHERLYEGAIGALVAGTMTAVGAFGLSRADGEPLMK